MALRVSDLRPSDIIAIRHSDWFGQAIQDLESAAHLPTYTHIAVVHHTDPAGVLWVIEGRPGGVGWRAANDYLRTPGCVANTLQPRTPEQRFQICAEMVKVIGTPYDWEGIAQDAARDLGLPLLWSEHWGTSGVPPAHVVCSSFAAWLYDHFLLPAPLPADAVHVEPGDWVDFIDNRGWLRPGADGP